MSSWNYRILHDGKRWWIGEVYYDVGMKPVSYTENASALDGWERQEDLVTTHRLVSFALEKPYLRVYEDGRITENLA